jgi:hypothetical protein
MVRTTAHAWDWADVSDFRRDFRFKAKVARCTQPARLPLWTTSGTPLLSRYRTSAPLLVWTSIALGQSGRRQVRTVLLRRSSRPARLT